MERDHAAIIAALRRKADDPSVGKEERDALNAKADELAKKYKIPEKSTIPVMSQEEFISKFFGTPDWEYSNTTTYTNTFHVIIRKQDWIITIPGHIFQFDANFDENPVDNEYSQWPQESGINDDMG